MAKKIPKAIDVLRIGNRWLVGSNVERVVPLYTLHNFCAPRFKRNQTTKLIQDLVVDAPLALGKGLIKSTSLPDGDTGALQETASGLLSPDGRIFRAAGGGASDVGALFPIVGGLLTSSSDDGLGRRLRELMARHDTDWRMRLDRLLAPSEARDPATRFAVALLGGDSGEPADTASDEIGEPPYGLDLSIVRFIDNLISDVQDARRVPAIRSLAQGLFMMAIVRMVSGPVAEESDFVPPVMVFGGLPPGEPNDPIVRAAQRSFKEWIGLAWKTTASNLYEALSRGPRLPQQEEAAYRRSQLAWNLEGLSVAESDLENGLKSVFATTAVGAHWCEELLESEEVAFPRSEFARRVRSLGGNIGFTGPDRGTGHPRLTLDTPLLGVLVRGVVGDESMEFADFVGTLSKRFGLVVGIGADDEIVTRVGLAGFDGFDPYEILEKNQEAFRRRLLRTGLARSYSDSHTEVFGNA